MPHSPLGLLLRQLSGYSEGAALAESSDGQLLERFVTCREEAAFAALLRRHGSMVLSVCRRALANEQDREDVFQATFLLLARKAGSIRKREAVGSWLHGVAHRLAMRRRAEESRRRVHERLAPVRMEQDPAAQAAWQEMQTALDEAIADLPEKYRSALVLCYLEDHTHEEAARRLGCRLTTLRSRVARGRDRLRAALVRRGLALSGAAFLAALATSAAQAVLPPALRMRTLTAALQFAKGDAVSKLVSASTSALVEGGLHAMSAVKMKMFVMLTLLSSLTLGAAGLLAHQILGVKDPAEPPQPVGERTAVPPPENKPKPAVDHFGDPLPPRAVARMGTVRFRMGGLVYVCAYSPDGKTLAAGSAAVGNISLFDSATGKLLRQFHGNQSDITSLAYSPDGRTLASGSADDSIIIWEVATGKQLRQIRTQPKQTKPIWSLAFTPDGKGLIAAGDDWRIRLWDAETGKEIRQFTGHTQYVRCAVLSPDGRTLASAAGREIRLWEMTTGKMLRRLTGHEKPIRALAISPDGKLLASGSDDLNISSIWLWETATGKVHRRFPEDPKENPGRRAIWPRSLAFSPDGKSLAAGYAGYGLFLWETATRKKLHEIAGMEFFISRGFHDGGIQCVRFSPDGKRLALARDSQLSLLDVLSGKEILPLPAHRDGLHQLFFSPDGKRLFTCTYELNGGIREWDAASGRMIRQLPVNGGPERVSFSPDRKILASGFGSNLSLFDSETGKETRNIALPMKDTEAPGDSLFSPDGTLLAIENFDGKTVWLYDAATGKQLCTVEGMAAIPYVSFLAFSADGRLLAVTDRSAIHLAEVPSGRQLLRIDLPKDRRASAPIAISPDGWMLAAWIYRSSADGTLTLWECASGKERLVFPGPLSQVATLAFSPDSRLLAAGGGGKTVFIWDTIAGKQAARLEGHQGNVESLAFTPDGRRLASASQDTTALIWDVSSLAKKLPHRGSLIRKELDELWSTLAGADAAKAYQAILTLESVPDQAVPLLAERLHLQSDNEKQLARLLSLLDGDDFAQRERATKELRQLGWAAEPALHKALEDKPSLEMRRRVRALLDDIRKLPLPPELLRMLRGIEVLEHIGTPAARRIIASLAEGTPQAWLTREAKAALQRLR